jgi:hypothetical protein
MTPLALDALDALDSTASVIGSTADDVLQNVDDAGTQSRLLLDNKADVNAQGGYYGNALQAASIRGHEKVVQILLDNEATRIRKITMVGQRCYGPRRTATWKWSIY